MIFNYRLFLITAEGHTPVYITVGARLMPPPLSQYSPDQILNSILILMKMIGGQRGERETIIKIFVKRDSTLEEHLIQGYKDFTIG